MEFKIESQNAGLTDVENEITKVKNELIVSNTEVAQLKEKLAVESRAHEATQRTLVATSQELGTTQRELKVTQIELDREAFVSSQLRGAEAFLRARCIQLMEYVKRMSEQLEELQQKLTRTRRLGKEQVLLFEKLNEHGLGLRQSIGRELDDCCHKWEASFEGIGKEVLEASRRTQSLSQEDLGQKVSAFQGIAKEHVTKLRGLWKSMEEGLSAFHTKINDSIADYIRLTDENSDALVRNAGCAAAAIMLSLQKASSLVNSLPEDISQLTESNKEEVKNLICQIHKSLSSTYSCLDKGLSENQASLSGLMNRLSDFKARQSKSLQSSLETIKQNLILQVNNLAASQQQQLNAEFSQLSSSCQQCENSLNLLKGRTLPDTSQQFHDHLCRFEDKLLPKLDNYNNVSTALAQNHSENIELTMNGMNELQEQVNTHCMEVQRDNNETFMKLKIPELLSENCSMIKTMQSTMATHCTDFSQIITKQSSGCNEQMSSMFTDLSSQMNLLQSYLSHVNTVMDTHHSQIHNSIQSFESTSTSTHQSSNGLSTMMSTIGDTPQPIKLSERDLDEPKLFPPREELIASYTSTRQERSCTTATEETMSKEDMTQDYTTMESRDLSVLPSIRQPELAPTTITQQSTELPALNQPELSTGVNADNKATTLLPTAMAPRATGRLRPSSTRTAAGSKCRSSSLTRKPREAISANGVPTAQGPSLRRASAASQLGHRYNDHGDTFIPTAPGYQTASSVTTSNGYPEPPSVPTVLGGANGLLLSSSGVSVSTTDLSSGRASSDCLMMPAAQDGEQSFRSSTTNTTTDVAMDRSDYNHQDYNHNGRPYTAGYMSRTHKSNHHNHRSQNEQDENQSQNQSPSKLGDDVTLLSSDGDESHPAGFARPTKRLSQALRKKHQTTANDKAPEGKRRRALSRDSRR